MSQNGKLDERPRPMSADLELAVLGTCLVAPRAIDEAAAILRPEDFGFRCNSILAHTIYRMHAAGEEVDFFTVQDALRRDGVLEQVGGTDYLNKLMELSGTSALVPDYAEKVKENARLRAVIDVCGRALNRAFALDDAAEIMGEADLSFQEVNTAHTANDGFDAPTLFFGRQHERENTTEVSFLRTGIRRYDAVLKGKPGYVVVMGGRPSQGKTGRVLDFGALYAKQGISTALFSCEQSKEEIADRMTAAAANVPLSKISDGTLTDYELQATARASLKLAEMPFHTFDDACQTVPQVRARVQRLKRTTGLQVVIVDQLNRMDAIGKVDNDNQRFSQVMRGLRNLAKQMDVLVFVLAQLSRNVESRPNKRPVLSDLRDCGNIEAEADIVAMQFRESFYTAQTRGEEEEDETECELAIQKFRQGKTGVIKDRYERAVQRFHAITRDYDDGDIPPERSGAGYPRRGNDDPFFESERGIR